jgi:superfamily I DNA and/or RNA helicase/very-short-patch-repair endonuclease
MPSKTEQNSEKTSSLSNVGALKEYEKKIVDLTRRNRLLKYPAKARAISFKMSISDFEDRFGSIEEIEIEFPHKAILEEEIVEGDERDASIPSTDVEGKKLITMLQALRLDSKKKFEEHGLHTLYLTIGRVHWKEPGNGRGSEGALEEKEYDYDAPILLIPVSIEETKSTPKKTIIRTYLEASDIAVNPVLLLLSELEYGVKISGVPSLEEIKDLSGTYDSLVKILKKSFADSSIKNDITDDIRIGQYSFYGQQIYEDLRKNEEAICGHEFVDGLIGKGSIIQKGLPLDSRPDDLLSVEEDFTVLDADVSQMKVIQKAVQGNSLVVQGPPGTGKSQTIVNLVSNLLARGKKVLVVCEKQVALEVVFKRLKEKGLDKLCLPLFYQNADKKTFAKTVINDRDFLIESYGHSSSSDDTALELREGAHAKLRNYAYSLAAVVDPLKRSVQWVHGELARAQSLNSDRVMPWGDSDPLIITEDAYRRILSILEAISPVLNKISNPKFLVWSQIQKENFSPDFASRVRVVLEDIYSAVVQIDRLQPKSIGLNTIQDLQRYMDTVAQLALFDVRLLPMALHEEIRLSTAIQILDQTLEVITIYQKLMESFGGNYKVPTSWSLTSLVNQPVNDDCKIEQIAAALQSAPKIEATLSLLHSNIEACKNGDLLGLPINELIYCRNILILDPLIIRIKDWNEASALQASLGSLTTLQAIYCKLEEANAVFEKWAIIRDDLDKDEIEKIFTEFGKKYHKYFYFFSRDYSSAKTIVSGWCNLNTPKRYADVNQVVSAVRDCQNLEKKLVVLLAQFNDKYVASDKAITVHDIPILSGGVKNLLEWMHQESKSELANHLKLVVEKNSDPRAMKTFSNSLKDLEILLADSWSIFSSFSNLDRVSISDVASKSEELTENARNIVVLEEITEEFLTGSDSSRTLGSLKNDIQRLNQLKACLDQISLDVFKLFASNEDPASLVANRESLEKITTELKKVFAHVLELPDRQNDISLRETIRIAEESRAGLDGWKTALATYENHALALNKLFENEQSIANLELLKIQAFQEKLSEMIQDQEGLEVWMEYRRYSHQMKDVGHSWFLESLKGSDIKNPQALFAESLWNAWLENYYRSNSDLRDFNVSEHRKTIEEFRRLEKRTLDVNAKRILQRIAPAIKKVKERRGEFERFLLHQSQLKKQHKPVRQVVMKCTSHIQQYKPCWMMSPLTLSSYIPYGSLDFDTVIFDEASQMRVEHALGAIARGKQIIIFGDGHQLPPTSFFDVASDDDSEEAEDQDYESILHAARTVLPESSDSLLYHYRSKYEDLIAFSNCEVYKDQLITFPNPDHSTRGVQFEYVENGIFDGGIKKENHAGTRRNDIEAMRVVEKCAESIVNYPDKSIGVIAFSKSQEVGIRDAMIEFLKIHPELQEKLNEDQEGSDSFFIKNLESVQGDERDIIVLSIGYGKDKNGNFFNRFGPINSVTGYRRLNVAVTRAKEKLICVSSFKSTEMKAGETSRGAKMLQKYLDYAENGVKTLDGSRLVVMEEDVEADSPFELEVKRALEQRGYEVKKQIGVSGFKIDLAIINPRTGTDYILGIECDGASYHSSYSARVNDRLREEILRRLGWNIYRIWSQHWLSHKEKILDDIVEIVNKNI